MAPLPLGLPCKSSRLAATLRYLLLHYLLPLAWVVPPPFVRRQNTLFFFSFTLVFLKRDAERSVAAAPSILCTSLLLSLFVNHSRERASGYGSMSGTMGVRGLYFCVYK